MSVSGSCIDCGIAIVALSRGGGRRRLRCATCVAKKKKIDGRERYIRDPSVYIEDVRRRRKAHPERFKAQARSLRLSKYGMTPEGYASLLNSQGNACAICRSVKPGGPFKTFAVDHCHATGTIRGLLCFDCNTSIGKLGDNPASLEFAAEYMRGRKTAGYSEALLF